MPDRADERPTVGDGPTADRPAATDPTLPGPPPTLPTQGAMGAETLPFAAGEPPLPTVAGYEVRGVLGHGGMGIVYRARDLRLGREVTLKMIRDGLLPDPAQRARFRAEARAVARLQHPHVVQIFEVGEQHGRPYFALELIEGGNLAQRLAGRPLPPREAATLVETLARAMHHAHGHGIVHRDLKPANILLTPDGTPKITDFGLAKELEASVFLTHTSTNALLGTPSYMAPEQAWGGGDVGPAADVYALGAVLYECLTGRPPFAAAKLMEVLDQVRSADPAAPRRLNPAVPRDLETVCLKCLDKEPAKRYPAAGALADELRRYRAGEPVRARRAGPWERAVKWARRRPAAAVALAAGLAAGTGAVAFRLDAQRREAAYQAEQRNAAVAEYPARLEEARRLALGDDRDAARALLDGTPADLRGWEWGHVRGFADGAGPVVHRGHEGHVTGLALGPDAVFSGDAAGTVLRWGADASAPPRVLRRHKGAVTALAVSPDGRRVASASWQGRFVTPDGSQLNRPAANSVFSAVGKSSGKAQAAPVPRSAMPAGGADALVYDAGNGSPVLDLGRLDAPVTCLAFRPDGGQLASASGRLPVLPAGTEIGEPAASQPTKGAPAPAAPASAPAGGRDKNDGRKSFFRVPARGLGPDWSGALAAAQAPPSPVGETARDAPGGGNAARPAPQSGNEVTLRDLGGDRAVRTLAGPAPVTHLAYAPDGGRLAVAYLDGSVSVWDTGAWQVERVLAGHDGPAWHVAWSADGGALATAGMDGTVRVWDPVSGRAGAVLREHSDAALAVAFHPGGGRLVSAGADRTLRVWDAAGGRQLLVLRGHSGPVTAAAFDRGGLRLVSAGADGTVRVWDARPAGGDAP